MSSNEVLGVVLIGNEDGSLEMDLGGTLEQVTHAITNFFPETLSKKVVVFAYDYQDGDSWFTNYRVIKGSCELMETTFKNAWENYVGVQQGNYPS